MPASFVERTTNIAQSTDEITELVEPWLAAERLELDDVEMVGSGDGRTLRILVDHPDGVDLDRLAVVSNGISRLLDDVPSLQAPYLLEVSSPGVDLPLKNPRQFAKHKGRKVKLVTELEEFKGTLLNSDEKSVEVEKYLETKKGKPTKTEKITIEMADIKEIKVLISFK